jgi:hypothetical protein
MTGTRDTSLVFVIFRNTEDHPGRDPSLRPSSGQRERLSWPRTRSISVSQSSSSMYSCIVSSGTGTPRDHQKVRGLGASVEHPAGGPASPLARAAFGRVGWLSYFQFRVVVGRGADGVDRVVGPNAALGS